MNGSLAKAYHQNEIEALFVELRKCLIQVSNLTSATKTFLLMSLDLYYGDYKSLGHNLERFYGKYLDEFDTNDRLRQPQITIDAPPKKDIEPSNNGSFSLRNLAKDFANLKARTNGAQEENRKINPEYLNRPLKASDRLKYFQNSNSSLSVKSGEDNLEKIYGEYSAFNMRAQLFEIFFLLLIFLHSLAHSQPMSQTLTGPVRTLPAIITIISTMNRVQRMHKRRRTFVRRLQPTMRFVRQNHRTQQTPTARN